MRERHLLGQRILGTRFSFDIRIRVGAGAYICGEESALIESAEGKRGTPRNRPPFPVVSGYRHRPTIVNNVETFGCAARIAERGPEWFRAMGTAASPGVKLLSVAGDCDRPGIYEVPWGVTVREVLELCGAGPTLAVQVGGPSGACVSERQFDRRLCYEDLGTGGAVTVFGAHRDLLSIVHNHMEFFANETCGFCVPCRAGNTLLLKSLEKIMVGNGTTEDLEAIERLGRMVKSGVTVRPGPDLAQSAAEHARELQRPLRGARCARTWTTSRSSISTSRPPSPSTWPAASRNLEEGVTWNRDRSSSRSTATDDPRQGRAERRRSRAGERHLHPYAVRLQEPAAGRHLPHLHGEGGRPDRVGLHHAGVERHGGGERQRPN